jgi:hypothetical protein
MPLQSTFSCRNFNDENEPDKIMPPSLSPPAPDIPITLRSRRQMRSLRGSALFNTHSSSSPTNQSSNPHNHSTTIPYQRSLQYYKDRRQIEKFQRNEGAVTSLAIDDSPSAVSQAVSPEQLSGPCMVGPPIIKLPTMMTATSSFITVNPSIYNLPVGPTSSLRQSSPLGPNQHSLPGWPVFPRSVREPDLYRLALRRFARQKLHIRRTGRKSGGVKKVG